MRDGDALEDISLRSIDLADQDDGASIVDTERPYEETYTDDEEMAQGLTSHAQRISGAEFGTETRTLSSPRKSPRKSHSNRLSFLPNRYRLPNRAIPTQSSPVRRQVSTIVKEASARIVNLSNTENDPSSSMAPDTSSPLPQIPEKDFFSQTITIPTGHRNPPFILFSGKSLGIFGPESAIRHQLSRILLSPVTEPLVLLLIIFHAVVLTIDSSYDVYKHIDWIPWTKWAILFIFILYTIEMLIRIVVSGLWHNPELSKTSANPGYTTSYSGAANLASQKRRKFSGHLNLDHSHQQEIILRRAYLRHSFNRIDFVAVVSFWIDFVLFVTHLDTAQHIFVFRALSCIRILRLLNITRGTATILRSLKKAAPLLVNVAFFVGSFWVLMAVIGVQSFKGSLRRQCIWVDPAGIQSNQTQYLQFCGGQWVSGEKSGYLLDNWQASGHDPKGYTCPEQSWCVQAQNPYNGSISFDNVFNSMELVFVIMSSNTFTDLMYYTMDSDYFTSALFFIAGTLLLTFWLMSLVIAVVTTSFQVIRDEQKFSAFGPSSKRTTATMGRHLLRSKASKVWSYTKWFWVGLILADLITQAFKRASMPQSVWDRFELAETIFTLCFAFEVIARLCCELPNWRAGITKANMFDLFLVVVTCAIQIPQIKDSGSFYRWMTAFQILRSYRIIQAIPFTRDVLGRILGNTSGLLNLVFFVFLSVYIAALLAFQLVHGAVPLEVYGESQEMTFRNIFNSFIGMYQILSSENWTTILYAVQSSDRLDRQAWIPAVFFLVWFVFSQNVLMSMFIAVLQENFEVSEDDKRREQVRVFVQKAMPAVANENNTSLTILSLFRQRRDRGRKTSHRVTQLGNMLEENNVRDFVAQQITPLRTKARTMQDQLQGPFRWFWDFIASKFNLRGNQTPRNPFDDDFNRPSQAAISAMAPHTMAAELAEAYDHKRVQQEHYLREHPEYDKVLWLFGPDSKLRRFCQSIVAPSNGLRMRAKTDPNRGLWYMFTAFMYLCTVGLVVLACITTPLYQKAYRQDNPNTRFPWFNWADFAFTIIFTVEFMIKVLADGFWLTPNAYFRNAWNKIDLFVLFTLWVNSAADILDRGSLSRAFGAFKALRALRLVNISDATKAIFYDVLIAGFWNIAGAAIVSVALLVPMAIWGLNMFSGLLYSCNDSSVDSASQCYYEYFGSPNNWNIWTPRAWENPQVWSFDSFTHSLLILFEIVSQEGWIDVMTSAMAITGRGDQPVQDASSVNALFFIIFNILGAVFVLTLFIAVIIQNYSERSGIAFLTTEQRSWQEMRLLLKQVRPSRRPAFPPTSSIRKWCFYAVKKRSTWNRCLYCAYCAHVVLLMTEHFPENTAYPTARNTIFMIFNTYYCINILVRIIGIGWRSFLRSRWNIFNLIVVSISTVLSAIVFAAQGDYLVVLLTADKVFLVLVAMNLIQAIDPLDQLFKTTAGALPALASLMATWLVLFVTFAIAFNQIFGLTKIGDNGSDNINFRTVPKALVVLFRMSCGEGWNSIMHDYAIGEPYCTSNSNFYETDCGSESWAYSLFISWNIVSMYIFVNIVISLVYSNFSYVYQRAGKMSSISRKEIRQFKDTWSKFDDGSGYIATEHISKFLSLLEGAFEVRIYPAEYSVQSIMANCRKDTEVGSSTALQLDPVALDTMTSMIDVEEIKRRRWNYTHLYTELLHDATEKGVSFTTMLLAISHYRFVDENKSLGLGEFLFRRNVKMEISRTLAYETIAKYFDSILARQRQSSLGRAKQKAQTATRPINLTLQIPTTTSRPGSRTLSLGSPLADDRYSWQYKGSSHTPSTGSPRPSISGTSQHSPNNVLDYSDMLAGTAWSAALEINQTHEIFKEPSHSSS